MCSVPRKLFIQLNKVIMNGEKNICPGTFCVPLIVKRLNIACVVSRLRESGEMNLAKSVARCERHCTAATTFATFCSPFLHCTFRAFLTACSDCAFSNRLARGIKLSWNCIQIQLFYPGRGTPQRHSLRIIDPEELNSSFNRPTRATRSAAKRNVSLTIHAS